MIRLQKNGTEARAMIWPRTLLGLLLVILPIGSSEQPRGLSHALAQDRSFAVTAVTEWWLAEGYPGLRIDRRPVRIETRIWYAGPDAWRIERHYLTPPPQAALVGVFLPGPSLLVRHSSIVWVYDARTRTYASRSPLDVGVAYPSAVPATFEAAALGEPFPSGASVAHTLPSFVQALGSCDTAKIVPISVPRVSGSATLLGRAAAVIDVGPRPCGWNSASEGEMMGQRLLWIDRQTFLLLEMARYSVYNRTRLFERVTVTRIRATGPLPATLFRFTPPPGAHHAPPAPPPLAPTKEASLAAIRQHIAFALFLPMWVPHHLMLRQATVDGTPHVALTYLAPGYDLSILEGPVGCCLDADPREYGGPTLPDGRVVNLLSVGAAHGGVIVWWDQAQTYMALSSATLTRADLLHIAASIGASGAKPSTGAA